MHNQSEVGCCKSLTYMNPSTTSHKRDWEATQKKTDNNSFKCNSPKQISYNTLPQVVLSLDLSCKLEEITTVWTLFYCPSFIAKPEQWKNPNEHNVKLVGFHRQNPCEHRLTFGLLNLHKWAIRLLQTTLPNNGMAYIQSQWRIQGVPPAHAPPTGPDSFILTYKFFET